MTSGKRICGDCGRGSPQGRHASCHVLAILRAHAGPVRKSELLRRAWPARWADLVPGEQPRLNPVDGAIRVLREAGHRIHGSQGVVWIREAK